MSCTHTFQGPFELGTSRFRSSSLSRDSYDHLPSSAHDFGTIRSGYAAKTDYFDSRATTHRLDDRRDRYRDENYGRRESNYDRRDNRGGYNDSTSHERRGEENAMRPSSNSDSPAERRVPIGISELIRMKEEKQAESSKLTFQSKAQRRANALKEREAEVAAQRASEGSLYGQSRETSSSHYASSSSRYGDEGASYSRAPSTNDRERELELEIIRKEKLGLLEQKKRKILKPSERVLTKVTFWDDSEDTTLQEHSSLYRQRAEARPQFGRGSFAGMDDAASSSNGDYRSSEGGSSYSDKLDEHRRSAANKDVHWSKKALSDMSIRDWRIFKEDYAITTKGGNIPNPIRSWAESGLPDWAMKAVKDASYIEPTAIQRQAIPIGLQGRDLIGVAETGSGKTASFLLPLLVHISKLPRLTAQTEGDGPYACVLAPTRELAQQIKDEADKFAKYANCRTVLLIGGEDLQSQVAELRRGCEIIVATTGRLVDLLNNAWLVLNQCHYVVLDEGDRMIDMGFEEQLLQILDAMPQTQLKSADPKVAAEQERKIASADRDHRNLLRTTVLFSATMPPAVERIANRYLRNPATIYVGEAGKTVDRIKQVVEFTKGEADKKRRLQELLLHGPKPPIIIFMNHKKACDAIAKFVERLGFITVVLHAGKSQEAREWAITEFKDHNADVLVATNVAGRGLDVKGVTHVINFDLPDSIDEYTHRIGRTGRAGMDGLATSFLTQNDDKILIPLRALLQKTNSKIPRELNELAAQSTGRPMY